MKIFQHRWWDEVSTQMQITFSIKVHVLFFKKIQNNISNAIFRGDYEKTDALNFEKQPPDLFLEKGVLKIWSKFTGKHRCQSVISMKLHGCSPVDLLQIFRTSFYKNTLWKSASEIFEKFGEKMSRLIPFQNQEQLLKIFTICSLNAFIKNLNFFKSFFYTLRPWNFNSSFI